MCIIPLANATFVPGLNFKCISAFLAKSISRGSTTISLHPLCTAWRICIPTTGCASSGLDPTNIITSGFLVISSIGLVIAPEPKVIARPATDAEWQTRAQLSTLFVPNAQRTNFCIM